MRRLVLWGLVLTGLVLSASPASAMQRRSWLCQSITGAAIPACSVTVYIAGTLTKATIYGDQAGATALGNPITGGTDGTYAYYAPSGRYTEILSASGFTFGAAQTQDFILHDPFAAPGVSPNIPATITWLNATANCTNVTPATAAQTICWDQTLAVWRAYTGTGWATVSIWNGNQATLSGTNNAVVFAGTSGAPLTVVGNAAGTSLALQTTTGALTHTIHRGDVAAGAQDVGNLTFEMPNASSTNYSAGVLRGKQTSNVAGSETGYLSLESIATGTATERARFGDPGFGSAVTALGPNFQFTAQFDTTHHLYLSHNGTTATLGTYESNPLAFVTNNTSALLIGTSQGLYTPNATGTDKGADTINALSYYANNNQFVNASGAIINKSVTFNSGLLNTLTANGMMIYCSDCTAAGALDQTCVGGGTGNLAVRINGVAKCAY